MKKSKEFLAGSFTVIFSIIVFISTFNIKSIGFSDINPDVIPKLVAAGLFLLGISLVVTGFRGFISEMKQWWSNREKREKPTGVWNFVQQHKLIASMLLMFIYFLGIQSLGFLSASCLYLFVQILILIGKISKKTITKVLIMSLSISGAIYVVFVYVFNMIMPYGILI